MLVATMIDKQKWREALRRAGVTQRELAAAMGMHVNSLSRKALGRREFTLSEFLSICRYLEVADPLSLLEVAKE